VRRDGRPSDMPIPTYEQMLRPILALAGTQDITRVSSTAVMIEHFGLSPEEREARLPSGKGTYVRNRAGWAMTFLTKGRLIEKVAPRTYRITAAGREFLAAHPTAITERDLRTLPGWKEAWQTERKEDEDQPTGDKTPLEALDAAITSAPPSPHDDPLRLHTRFLAGQPHALDCLASVFLKVLPQRLGRAFPRVPWDFTLDAATDACLEYAANPARFDRFRSASILDFVYLIARRNLANRVRAEIALKNREVRYAKEHPGLLPPALSIRGSDINLWAAISTLTIDPRERRAAELWLDDAGTDAIAEALGMGHLAQEDQGREAKRFKDRLLKRLFRYFRPLPGRP
jgi:hypothetical protein